MDRELYLAAWPILANWLADHYFAVQERALLQLVFEEWVLEAEIFLFPPPMVTPADSEDSEDSFGWFGLEQRHFGGAGLGALD